MADGRVHVSFRIGPGGKQWIDQLAEKTNTDRSEVIRQGMIVARKHETELIARLKEQA